MSETSLLIAHEALHIWNGHRLIPNDSAEESTRWFKEGVTHYLALKSLGADESFVLEELARSASNYERNPLSRGASGQAVDEARFPYDFGVLVALTFDALLTDGAQDAGLECWLKPLVDEHHRYDEHTLLAADAHAANRPIAIMLGRVRPERLDHAGRLVAQYDAVRMVLGAAERLHWI